MTNETKQEADERTIKAMRALSDKERKMLTKQSEERRKTLKEEIKELEEKQKHLKEWEHTEALRKKAFKNKGGQW